MNVNILDLINENNRLQEEVQRLRDVLGSGDNLPDFETWSQAANVSFVNYIDSMAAAFCKLTNKNPKDCYLVTAVTDDNKKVLYWFEDKENLAKENVVHKDYLRAY